MRRGVGTAVVEGVLDDTYTVALTRAPDPGETVTVTLEFDNTQISAPATLEFNAGNWNVAQTVTVTAVNDGTAENSLDRTITHTITSDGPVYGNVLEKPEVEVRVRDNDAGGLLVTPSDGATLVAEGVDDTYTLQLTKQPTADVEVGILTDGKSLVTADNDPLSRFSLIDGVPTVTFDDTNWNVPFTVRVSINPAAEDDAGSQPTRDKYGVIAIAVVHYVGEFEVGDPLFLAVVAGSHRGETQKALNEIIERVKYELDFKNEEHTDDGTNIIMSGG